MTIFQPRTEYRVSSADIPVKDLWEYSEEYVVRPPYQRKNVWPEKKQQKLLDSLFRRYYVPRLVLRVVRVDEERIVREVVDGQQRIVTVQRFFAGALRLPSSLNDLHSSLPGARYQDLDVKLRQFVDRHLKYEADLIEDVEDPRSPVHQNIATEIFWRLQQGESLNFMEVAHARLSSLLRNFLVKYGDDITFDYETYQPVEQNPDKHRFFHLVERNNDRMQHLALLGRFLLIERAGGPTDVRDATLSDWIDTTQTDNGVGNESFEQEEVARSILKTLNLFVRIFRDDPMIDEKSGLQELRTEYFIISMVMLLRHLRSNYGFSEEHYELFRQFLIEFHQRWKAKDEDDRDILLFADNRQQSQSDLENRDRVVRQLFFEFLRSSGAKLPTRDKKRSFNEAERILIYRRDDGLCHRCKEEGRPADEARVSWSQFQADHIIPWARGGETQAWNGQILCRYHNAAKGAG